MTKTLRIMARAGRTFAVHAVIAGAVGGAGWLYVRGLLWLAQSLHSMAHVSWDEATGEVLSVGVLGLFMLCVVLPVILRASRDYFAGVWRQSAAEVAREEVSEDARDTLLRGSGGR